MHQGWSGHCRPSHEEAACIVLTTPLPTGVVARRGGRSGWSLDPFRPHTRSKLPTGKRRNLGLFVVSPMYGSRQCVLPLSLCERQALAHLLGCFELCTQKSHWDRRERRVQTRASCATVTAEHFLNFFVGRQLSPGSTFFDDFPFFSGNIIVLSPAFKPPQESSHPPAARSTPDRGFPSPDPLSSRDHTTPFRKYLPDSDEAGPICWTRAPAGLLPDEHRS